MSSLKRNIPLLYIILGMNNALFWSPIWIIFYLRFTNYAGIGLLETVMIITIFLIEIPTGAIADLFGKKKTLTLGLILIGLGNIWMASAGNYSTLAVTVFIMSVGTAFLSGTTHALLYDTLLSLKQEDKYEKILGYHSTIKMIVIGVASITGGIMYSMHPGLPYLTVGITRLLAAVICLFLIEPPIDSEKFSLPVYIQQTKHGFGELFRNKVVAISSIAVILLTSITFLDGGFLLDAQIVAQGWNEQALGVITAAMFFLSALMAQFTSVLSSRFGKQRANIIAAFSIAISMIIIPWFGMIAATIIIVTRNGLIEIFGNTANAIINNNVRSQYRATALSAYSMLASIPYVFGAYAVGYIIDTSSVNTVISLFGGLLVFFVAFAFITTTKTQPKLMPRHPLNT